MRLTILGSGTVAWDSGRACSSYHLAAGDCSILFDCGSGSLKRCVEAGIDFFALDAIALSHTRHPDHSADLASYLFAINVRITAAGRVRRTKPLRLVGPRGLRRHYEVLTEIHSSLTPEGFALEIDECAEDEIAIGGVRLIARTVTHGDVPALGFRVEHASRAFAYSGDTGPCAALVDLFRAVDLGVIECSFPAGAARLGVHLDAREAGAAAEAAGARRLVVTHQYPIGDRAAVLPQIQESYRGPVEFAQDLAQFDV
jgi:ribonuclease BN (tRNA processing enzyme)